MRFSTRAFATACTVACFTFGTLGYALAQSTDPERDSNAEVHLVSFGSIFGEAGDCNCSLSAQGSLARRAGYLDRLKEGAVPLLHLDLGNFSRTYNSGAERNAEFIWNTMKEMDIDASTPGPQELQLWPLLRRFIDEDTIPFVSSNLRYVEDGEERSLAHEYLILDRGGIRIALFALMGREPFETAEIPSGTDLRLVDPVDTTRKLLPILQSKADVVVLISQMTNRETHQLLSEIEGIDVALYGYRPNWVEHNSRISGTIVQQTGSSGLYLGHLVLIVDPQGEIVDWGTKNAVIDKSFQRNLNIAARAERYIAETRWMQAESRRVRDGDREE